MLAGNAGPRGFTLVELLVSIVVVVILATMAVPSFNDLIVRNRLAADTNEIVAGINYARSEAIKRRDQVSSILTSSGGGNGWLLEVWHDDGSGSVSCEEGVQDPKCLQVRDRGDSPVAISSSGLSVTFNALGRLPLAAGGGEVEVVSGGYSSCISVLVSGEVVSEGGACD